MISVENRERVEGRAEVAGEVFELVAKTSSVAFATGSFGFSVSYRRPTAISSESSGSRRAIRDHVMVTRVGAVMLIALSIARRYSHG